MAAVIQKWRDRMFPSELNVIELEGCGKHKQVKVLLKLGDNKVFEATLTATSEGKVRMGNLMPLLRDHTTDPIDGVQPQYLSLNVGDTPLASCLLIPCRVRVADVTAMQVVNNAFLTFAGREPKLIPQQAKEMLYWYKFGENLSQVKATANACWWNAETQQVENTEQRLEVGENVEGGLFYLDASPKILTAPRGNQAAWALVSYEVKVGARTMRYRLMPQGMNLAPVTGIRYRNALGVDDTFYFFGAVTEKLKPTYSAAQIGGVTRNYRIEAQTEWEAQTGPMTRGMERLLHDVAVARRAWLLADGEEITLMGCEIKQSNEWGIAPTAAVSWREAGEGQRLMAPTGVRTFDGSFDEAFL
jgi:hypothetical protein